MSRMWKDCYELFNLSAAQKPLLAPHYLLNKRERPLQSITNLPFPSSAYFWNDISLSHAVKISVFLQYFTCGPSTPEF